MRRTYRIMYRLGVTPWDSRHVPAPVIEAARRAPGTGARAVDLGCGTGRQARYLAEQGWSVTAVDYLAQPINTAHRRDRARHVDWRIADVTDQAAVDPHGMLATAVSLIVDNGCLHGIPEASRPGWARTVNHLAARDCLLLVRAAPPRNRGGIGPSGIDADELTSLLGPGWQRASSPAPNWYRFLRTEG